MSHSTEVHTILKEFHAIKASAITIPLLDIQLESIHAHNVYEMEISEFFIGAVGKWTPRIACHDCPRSSVIVGHIQDSIIRNCPESECFCTPSVLVSIPYSQLGRPESKTHFSTPETW